MAVMVMYVSIHLLVELKSKSIIKMKEIELMLGLGVAVGMSFCSLSCASSMMNMGLLSNPLTGKKDGPLSGGDGLLGSLLGGLSAPGALLGAAFGGGKRRVAGALLGGLLG